MNKLGIDLGGTKIEGVILDDENRERFRQRLPTEQEHGYKHILNNIKKLYELMLDQIEQEAHTFGIGTPGAISPRTGLMKNSNTLCLNDQPLKQDLEALLGRKIIIQNDANCFALAEAISGAAMGRDLVFGVIMGTGCGGGIVRGGDVITGMQAITGEWGHMSIDPNGPQCWCGSRGCVESLISGGGLERLYEQQYGVHLSATDIVNNYRKSKSPDLAFVNTFFRNFGRAMANLINILDPDMVVLGGGLSNINELYAEGVKEVARFIFSDSLETPIVKNKLGDSAGVIGAALIGC
ncbi:ROK family protein [candidate division KSB1 bacterium]|nr:ROK family protein [candidate division KSB1 bacterium]NIR71571.1 ROK family protein [candidate division KSB1 bacterium]NIS27953.1 ROK family protein [candidate division KSB1 bacterium]NIT74834.1 ROK family protein [candidate division KSB1 bacterium]NIU28610.1 ROK family protein [candidate division KSB1 bacterium]